MGDLESLALVNKEWRAIVFAPIISYLDKNKDKLALFLRIDENSGQLLHNLNRLIGEYKLQMLRKPETQRPPITLLGMDSIFNMIRKPPTYYEAKLIDLYRELHSLKKPRAMLLHFTIRLNTIQNEVEQEIRQGMKLGDLLTLIKKIRRYMA